MQEQDKNITNSYTLCRQVALPGTGVNEYCLKDVYQEVWNFSPLG